MDDDLYQDLKSTSNIIIYLVIEKSKMQKDSDNIYKKYKLNLEYLNWRYAYFHFIF